MGEALIPDSSRGLGMTRGYGKGSLTRGQVSGYCFGGSPVCLLFSFITNLAILLMDKRQTRVVLREIVSVWGTVKQGVGLLSTALQAMSVIRSNSGLLAGLTSRNSQLMAMETVI